MTDRQKQRLERLRDRCQWLVGDCKRQVMALLPTQPLLRRVIAGGAVGAWAVSFLVHLYIVFRWPQMPFDGQYSMVFMVTLPAGWLPGSILGALAAFLTVPRPHPPLRQVSLTVLLGCLILPFAVGLVLPALALTVGLPVELLTRWWR